MNSKHFLTLSSLAIGVATAISAAPASAVSLTNSSLAFSDGTSNFFEQVNPVAGNQFSVNFNPGGVAFVSAGGRSGAVVPFFPAVGSTTYTLAPSTGNFTFAGVNAANTFDYALNGPLSFNFTNGVNLNVGSGTVFRGALNNITRGVDFSVINSVGSTLVNAGDITPVTSLAFSFGDIPDGPQGIGGGYTISVATVPEPFTVIGTLIGGTAAFRMRKKLTSSVEK